MEWKHTQLCRLKRWHFHCFYRKVSSVEDIGKIKVVSLTAKFYVFLFNGVSTCFSLHIQASVSWNMKHLFPRSNNGPLRRTSQPYRMVQRCPLEGQRQESKASKVSSLVSLDVYQSHYWVYRYGWIFYFAVHEIFNSCHAQLHERVCNVHVLPRACSTAAMTAGPPWMWNSTLSSPVKLWGP